MVPSEVPRLSVFLYPTLLPLLGATSQILAVGAERMHGAVEHCPRCPTWHGYNIATLFYLEMRPFSLNASHSVFLIVKSKRYCMN